MNKEELVSTRGYLPEDRNFILSTFLRGLYYGGSVFSDMPKALFMNSYHPIVERILDANVLAIRVSCLKDDPSVILGYSVLNQSATTLHWVFVKKAWRSIGIAKSLVPSTISTVSHLTKPGKSIIVAKGLIFNPFSI